MEIRFLNADDAPEWSRLRLESLRNDPTAFSSSEEDDRARSLDEIKRRLGSASADSFVVGAFENGRLVGMAGFHRETGLKSRHKGRVWGVYVTSASRGTGLGRKILETLLQRAATIDGMEQILISVTTTQVAATALYRSLGFVPFGCELKALKIDGQFIDEEHMAMVVKHPGCC